MPKGTIERTSRDLRMTGELKSAIPARVRTARPGGEQATGKPGCPCPGKAASRSSSRRRCRSSCRRDCPTLATAWRGSGVPFPRRLWQKVDGGGCLCADGRRRIRRAHGKGGERLLLTRPGGRRRAPKAQIIPRARLAGTPTTRSKRRPDRLASCFFEALPIASVGFDLLFAQFLGDLALVFDELCV
jgi:hypothetical protein